MDDETGNGAIRSERGPDARGGGAPAKAEGKQRTMVRKPTSSRTRATLGVRLYQAELAEGPLRRSVEQLEGGRAERGRGWTRAPTALERRRGQPGFRTERLDGDPPPQEAHVDGRALGRVARRMNEQRGACAGSSEATRRGSSVVSWPRALAAFPSEAGTVGRRYSRRRLHRGQPGWRTIQGGRWRRRRASRGVPPRRGRDIADTSESDRPPAHEEGRRSSGHSFGGHG